MKSIIAASIFAMLCVILIDAPPCSAQVVTSPYICDVGLVSGSAVTTSPEQVQASIAVSGANGCIGFIEISTWALDGTNYVLGNATTTGYGVGTYTVAASPPKCAYKVVLSNPPDGNLSQAPAGPTLGVAGGGSGTCSGMTSNITLNQNTLAIPATGASSDLGASLTVAAISYVIVLLRRAIMRKKLGFIATSG